MTKEEILHHFQDINFYYNDCGMYDDLSRMLDELIAENKGEWIIREDNTSFVKQIPRRWVECSHCGWSFSYDRIHDDFCSKCGARMKGGE